MLQRLPIPFQITSKLGHEDLHHVTRFTIQLIFGESPLGIQAPPIEPFAKSSMIPQAVSLWPGILLSASPFFVPSAPPALIALAHPLDICSVWFPHSGLSPLLRAPRVLSGPLCHINYFTVVFAALDVSQPTPKTTSVSFTSLSLTACHRAWHIALQ